MKILVTGGAGFIGSAVVRLAIARGHRVVNVDALTYAGNLENVASVAASPRYVFAQADIRDRRPLEQLFAVHQPDAVLHLAAESHVDRSIDAPADFISTNIIGTFNLLEAARHHWLRSGRPDRFRFHHVSTDEVYGSLPRDTVDQRFSEATRYDPHSPYAAAKASADHLARAWQVTYGLPVIVTNCSNNYGPFQFPEKLIPLMILSALAGRPLPIYGDGSNVRDWLHVEDHADALLHALEHAAPGSTYTIGGDCERTNLQLVTLLCELLDDECPRAGGTSYRDLIEFVSDRPGHDARYAIDPTRIRGELGWQPQIGLAEGLLRTIRWYRAHQHWWRPLAAQPTTRLGLGCGHSRG
jgi:dTDP-glucose 4,6-dehydratase